MPLDSKPSDNRQHHRPFGENIEAPKDNVGYTSHKLDTDLGLSYMQQRYMDPMLGRFMSNEPIDFRDIRSFNRYVYANPYKYTDLDGNNALIAGCAAGPNPMCVAGGLFAVAAVYHGVKGTTEAIQGSLSNNKKEGNYSEWVKNS